MYDLIIKEALEIWGLQSANVEFVTQRENHMYRVTKDDVDCCLRIHRKGLRSKAEIESELQWIAMLSNNGLIVPNQFAAQDGATLHNINGYNVDMMNWLSGDRLGIERKIAELKNPRKVLYDIGKTLAKLHNQSDDWNIPKNFERPIWDREGLMGKNPIWGRFWENHCLYFTDRTVLISVKEYAYDLLGKPDHSQDYGLIHADLLPENITINNGTIQFMNFGDCGFGYRLFDIATILNSMIKESDYEIHKAALLDGYKSERPLDESYLLLFQALRSFTYLSWIVPRLNEPGGAERCKKFIKEACGFAAEFMARGQ
jgi:Ser/Thr protein kinase RdoA (MazF antagonist)